MICSNNAFLNKKVINSNLFLDNLQNISSILETVQTTTNRQVQLKCITFNSPFLEVKNVWFFRGIILNETDPRYTTYTYQFNSSETWRITQMSLWIRNVSHSDFGIYSCVVNSSVGMSLKNISLVQMEAEIGNHISFYFVSLMSTTRLHVLYVIYVFFSMN